jgi:hypothetical protein
MSEVLPALPGTTAYAKTKYGQEAAPVIGWEKILGRWEPVCFPETFRSERPMCIEIPCENPDAPNFYDVETKTYFDNHDDWLAFYEGKAPEAPGPAKRSKTRSGLRVTFGTKVYKNKSFWHFKTEQDEFLFELEGDETCPDDPRVEKINRDQFFKARKMMDVLTMPELLGAAPETDSEVEDLI